MFFASSRGITTKADYAIATDNPASWAEAFDQGTTAGVDSSQAMGYATRPESSATGNGTCSQSSQLYNIGQMISISPAAGGGYVPFPSSEERGARGGLKVLSGGLQ